MHDNNTCDCRFCSEFKKIEAVKAKRDPDELIEVVSDLFMRLTYSEEDNNRYKAIFDGSWPSCKSILQRAIDKQTKTEYRAMINGSSLVFNSLQEKFDALVFECNRTREKGSSVAPFHNDAYGQIVALGWPAVPLLLGEIERDSGHWFTALTWITGLNLVPQDQRGNIRAMREIWINWGKKYFNS